MVVVVVFFFVVVGFNVPKRLSLSQTPAGVRYGAARIRFDKAKSGKKMEREDEGHETKNTRNH